jgi:GNAT superfamily N-acetyltransferase
MNREPGSAPVVEIKPVPADSDDAIGLIQALEDELRARYPGMTPHGLRADDPTHPRFVFMIAYAGGQAIGCGAIRELPHDVGEVKRMFVHPRWRGRGVARKILTSLEAHALERGYVALRLETGSGQPEAIGLYRSAGYREIPAFGDDVGNVVSVCFEKRLSRLPL